MAESEFGGEQTEPATPRKRQEARKHGQVARSLDLATALVLLAATLVMYFYGEGFMAELAQMTGVILGRAGEMEFTPEDVVAFGIKGLAWMIVLMAPLVIAVFLVGIAANLLQVGVAFTPQVFEPRWNKLNPITGLQNLFGLQGWIKLVEGLLKVAAVGVVMAWTLWEEMPRMHLLVDQDLVTLMGYLGEVSFKLALRTAIVLLLVGVLDYLWQRWRYERDLKMTKQEVKDEMRMVEGDPQIRQRRRRVQIQLALKRMLGEVKKADVVITNPTELAIALRYESGSAAPRVVAKGAGKLAERIRELAAEHGVPIVEKRELAQALYKAVEVGDYVPEKFWNAVAEILAYVYRLSGKLAGLKPA